MTATTPIRTAIGQSVYTPAEVAGVLRVSEESVRREIRRGSLGAARIGSQYRLTSGDLATWLGEVRYRELFSPLGALSEIIGTGTLEEDEASATATKLVAAVRAGRPAPLRSGRAAPSPEDVRLRLEARRKSERQNKRP